MQIGFPAVPLFCQYKLPELMTRASAVEIAGGLCPGLTLEFFRIALMRRDLSDQHQLLIDWEGRYPGQMFYAAPSLRDCAAFNAAYNGASAVSHSVLFSPVDIGPLPDDKVHTTAYKPSLSYGYFCSEPRQFKVETFDGLAGRLPQKLKDKNVRDFRATAQEVRRAVLEAASPVWRQAEDAVAGRVRQALPPITMDGPALQPDREQPSPIGCPPAKLGLCPDTSSCDPSPLCLPSYSPHCSLPAARLSTPRKRGCASWRFRPSTRMARGSASNARRRILIRFP